MINTPKPQEIKSGLIEGKKEMSYPRIKRFVKYQNRYFECLPSARITQGNPVAGATRTGFSGGPATSNDRGSKKWPEKT